MWFAAHRGADDGLRCGLRGGEWPRLPLAGIGDNPERARGVSRFLPCRSSWNEPFALVYKPVRLGEHGPRDTDVCGSTDGAVASASINAGSISSSNRRITSPPAALLSASVDSEPGRLIQGTYASDRGRRALRRHGMQCRRSDTRVPGDVLLPVVDLLTRLPVERHGQAALISALSRRERMPVTISAF